MAGIDRRKKPSKPHERQQGSAATATATQTGVTTFPKTPPKDTTTYYGGGGSQAVKPYTSGSQKVLPTTPPKTTPSTSTPTTGTPSSSYLPSLPSFTEAVKSIATGQPPQSWTTLPSSSSSRSSSRSSSSSKSSRSSGSSGTNAQPQPQPFTAGYASSQVQGGTDQWAADAETGTGVNWQQGPQFIYDWSNSYRTELANLRDEELALAARLNDQFMRQLDQQIAQYTRYYEEMGQGIDPATEAALARLKQEMEQDQRMIMEYLNARGIAQSGIAAEEVGRLAGSFADQKSQMLAQRLTDLQNQFLSSMQNFMGQAMQGMGQYTQNAMGAQQRYSQGMQGAMQNAMEKTFGAWQQEQQQRAQMEREMIPYTQGPTPYQQQQLNYQRQSQSQQAAYQNQQAQRAAQQQQAQAATNEAISRLASYPSREAAEASIRNTAQGLAQMGVDIQALYKALDMYWPMNNLNQYFNQ
jgi:hypothetical protein